MRFCHLFFVLSAAAAVSSAGTYTYTSLDYPGADTGSTTASGINDTRQVVGGYAVTAPCAASYCRTPYGFLYSAGSFSEISYPGSSGTAATGINDSGQVVGWYTNATNSPQNQNGFLYSSGAYFMINVPSARATVPAGINSAGQVVGGYQPAGGGSSGFLYNGTTYTTVNFPGATGTTLTSINDVGQVAGLAQNGSVISCFYGAIGSFTTVDTSAYPGYQCTSIAINNGGQLALTLTESSSPLAFLWVSGVFTQLMYPQSATTSVAGLNNNGDVAGTEFSSGLSNAGHGYYATTSTALSISSLSPNSATAGGPAFTLTVNGANIVSGAAVKWNGNALTTNFVNSGQVTASVGANLIATQGNATVTVTNPGGATSNPLTFTINPAPGTPTLSSLSPNSITAGSAMFTLTVNGTNFASLATVLWNGSALATSFVASTQMTATVPASLVATVGTATVTVQNPGGATSNGLTFTITATAGAPTLTSLSPNSDSAGAAAFTMTVYGGNFVNGATVLWNGSALSTSFVSTTQVTAVVTANLIASVGSAMVTAQNPGSPVSNGLTFTINSSSTLSITTLSPSSATAGGPAFTLTVTGSNFASNAIILWNGSSLSTTYFNNQLSAPVAAGLIATAGTATITVQNPGIATSNSLIFTINSASGISISSLSPNVANAGGPAFIMTVNGTNFLSGATVLWNGSGLSTSFVGSNQLTAQVTANLITAVGTAIVTVQNPGGATSNGLTFTIASSNALTISSLSPNSAAPGGAAFTLTVIGANILSGASVLWNGTPLSTTYINSAQVTALIGANLIATAGTATVAVENPGGAISNSLTFTIGSGGGAFSISSLSPSSATAGGPAFILTVNGSAFQVGAAVLWGGSFLDTVYVSASQLTASVPANLIAYQSAVGITVENPGGTVSNSITFTINSAAGLSLTGISPGSTTAGGAAFNMTVTGSGFLNGATVFWNTTALTTSFVSSTQLTATVPAGLIAAQGSANITVQNPSGASTSALTFTINAAGGGGGGNGPSITTASPLPAGTVGTAYSQAITATGGTPPYTGWTVVAGSLPPGLSLSSGSQANTGLLSGTPTSAGTFQFTIQVTDSASLTGTAQFSLKIGASSATLFASGIVNAASYAGGSVAPGEIVTIFGSFPGPATVVGLQLSNGYVSTNLSGAQVMFDGLAAPMVYAVAGQVAAVVPYEVNGRSTTQVQVSYNGQTSNTVAEPVTAVMPGVFAYNASGSGEGAILNQDTTVNSASNPAARGSIIAVYATGEGQTNPGGVDGMVDGSPAPKPVLQPVTASVGGIPATVEYAGGVPGLVAGVLQVNILIPQGVSPGSSVPVVLNIGEQNTQSSITVAVQ